MTPLRPLTDREREAVDMHVATAAQSPVALRALIAELIVAREVVRVVRSQARCLPHHVRVALDGLPHMRHLTREYSHD